MYVAHVEELQLGSVRVPEVVTNLAQDEEGDLAGLGSRPRQSVSQGRPAARGASRRPERQRRAKARPPPVDRRSAGG